MAGGRIIDMWAPWLPVPEMVRHLSDNYPDEMLGYLRVFYKREPRAEEFAAATRELEMSEEQVIALLDQAGIGRTLITGFDEWSSVHETFIPNELVAEIDGTLTQNSARIAKPPTSWLNAKKRSAAKFRSAN